MVLVTPTFLRPTIGVLFSAAVLSFAPLGVSGAFGSLIITNTLLTPGGIVLSGTGGSNNATYLLRATANPSTPTTNWPAVATNNFDPSGNFNITNLFAPGTAGQFYRLQIAAPATPDFSLLGFAALSGFTSNGTLQVGGTTGGAAGAIVVASNLTWLVNYVQWSNIALRVLITVDNDCSSLNHNYFINVDERTPRMRYGNAHVFNQYTDNRTATNSTGKCIQACPLS